MTTVNKPRFDIPIAFVSVGGREVPCMTNREFVRFFEDLTKRVGGVSGTNADDVTEVANQALGLSALRQSFPQTQAPDFGSLMAAVNTFQRMPQPISAIDESQTIIAGKVFGGR